LLAKTCNQGREEPSVVEKGHDPTIAPVPSTALDYALPPLGQLQIFDFASPPIGSPQ
jgi:hypothetical protein